ncbi:hypothetical protein EG799_08180 [Aurantiacibacter spongiae]|uniref:Uncharacterized protein n=1 Tax=Aurantiacibacter spongiae TaxID=2488860 RepID=A0A3N5CVF2_9SPHN|nr:hypothetical protein EG799_08180 [Aurantiacibacter spongiae]
MRRISRRPGRRCPPRGPPRHAPCRRRRHRCRRPSPGNSRAGCPSADGHCRSRPLPPSCSCGSECSRRPSRNGPRRRPGPRPVSSP